MLHIPIHQVVKLIQVLRILSSFQLRPTTRCLETCLHIHTIHNSLRYPPPSSKYSQSHKLTLDPAEPSHDNHPRIGTTARKLGGNASSNHASCSQPSVWPCWYTLRPQHQHQTRRPEAASYSIHRTVYGNSHTAWREVHDRLCAS